MSTVSPSEPNESKGVGAFLDANVYATKKSIAQGMLDVALLTANASQLKYLLQVGHKHEFYTIMVALISTSIILQILIGLVLVVKYRFNINKQHQRWYANFFNNLLVWMIFGATLCNVFISAFGIDPILVGVFIVVLGTVNLNKEKNHVRANILNNMVTIFIFMITVVNIVISSFGMKSSDAPIFAPSVNV